MKIEIDQSGRIEETGRDTVIGLTTKKEAFTVKVPAKVKRQLLEIFRRQGKPRVFSMVIFGRVIGIAIKKSKFDITDLTIDMEYPGHEDLIRSLITSVVGREINCWFKSVGKKSKAHYVAYGVFMGRKKVDIVLRLKDIVKYLE